jgi:hypothetical protein
MQDTVLAVDVREDAEAATFVNEIHQFGERKPTYFRRHVGMPARVRWQPRLNENFVETHRGLVGFPEAEDVNTFAARDLESGEKQQSRFGGPGPKFVYPADVVVLCDGDDAEASLDASVDVPLGEFCALSSGIHVCAGTKVPVDGGVQLKVGQPKAGADRSFRELQQVVESQPP